MQPNQTDDRSSSPADGRKLRAVAIVLLFVASVIACYALAAQVVWWLWQLL
jgi:hypothetical protein